MSDNDETIEAIRQRMREVRGALGNEVEDLVASTRDMTDWRKYIRASPWICLAAAAAAGYFLVPTRRSVAGPLARSDIDKLVRGIQSAESKPKTSRIRSEIVSFVSNAALRAAMGFIGSRMAAPSMSHGVEEHSPLRRSPK